MKDPGFGGRANLLGAEAKQHGARPQRLRRPLQQRRDFRLLLLPERAALCLHPPAPVPAPPSQPGGSRAVPAAAAAESAQAAPAHSGCAAPGGAGEVAAPQNSLNSPP